MRRAFWLHLGLSAALLVATPIPAPAEPAPQGDLSFRNELQRAIDRGLTWLQANQNSNGWWSTPDHPAMTALALMAYQGEPSGRYRRQEPDWLRRGYGYVLGCVQPDGGIHRSNLITYNTALSMMALLVANKPEYEPALRNARKFLVSLQSDFGEKGVLDNPFDGGIGYGSHYDHSDMGNTLQALEALYYSKHLVADKNATDTRDLNYAAAIHFLQRCQNLPSHNPETWASDDATNKGGFIYYPGHSMAGGTTNAQTGRVALRSYGSISYGGLLSYIYADLSPDDPRVRAVLEWLGRNYTLEENPAMGAQGLFYYYHTMAKALSTANIRALELSDGRKVNWRKELGSRLLDLQQRDGSWANTNGRWWEKDPVLVTAYCLLSLEIIYRGT
jgi:squalene-hopene/tetraprenyl-beta-curcumene cyclase